MTARAWDQAARSTEPVEPTRPLPAEGDAGEGGPATEILSSHTTSPEPSGTAAHGAPSFDAFYARELPQLVALAQALCGRPVADDIAQEAMIAAFRRWSEVSCFVSPEAWVRRVCANQATSVLRRRAAEARAVLRLGARVTATQLEPTHEVFWDEVRRLPRRQAQATALRYVYGLTVAEVAATLGCTEGSAKVHLSRARAVLAARLADAEEGS